MRLDAIWRSSSRKELIWIKTNTEKKEDKVLPWEKFTLISFNVKAFTQADLWQMWMSFYTFASFSSLNCVIRIHFNLDEIYKGWKLL